MSAADFIGVFKRSGSGSNGGDWLLLSEWSDADWGKLFERTQPQPFRASEVVIHRGATDRILYFVVSGVLEVGITQVDGVTMTPLARILAGSVVGEQSFFDAQPRSANVWAVSAGELRRLDIEEFHRFGRQEPALARDLLFALGRVLSTRLRNTTSRVRR